MEFGLSKQHEMLRQMYREFAETEVKPLAAEVDEEEKFPEETVAKMAKAGFFGIPIPKEYGGEGGDDLGYAMAVEELARVCATTSVIISAHTSLCAWPILKFGTEAQKQKYLVPLAKGEHIGAFGLTEPNAGTDASMQQTTAVLDGDAYVLNGSKIFITNAEKASTYIIMAMTDKTQGTRGISAFIVEKGMPGFSFGLPEKKMGIRGSHTCELILKTSAYRKKTSSAKKAWALRSLCRPSTAAVSVSLHRHSALRKAHLQRRSPTSKKENNSDVRSPHSRTRNSSLQTSQTRLKRQDSSSIVRHGANNPDFPTPFRQHMQNFLQLNAQ